MASGLPEINLLIGIEPVHFPSVVGIFVLVDFWKLFTFLCVFRLISLIVVFFRVPELVSPKELLRIWFSKLHSV